MNDRILFIRLSAFGDIINTLPALAALKRARPELVVDWLVEDRFADFVRLLDDVDRCLVFPRRRLRFPWIGGVPALSRHSAAIRAESYLAAIDFQGNLKGGLHLAAVRAERKIGLDAAASREGAHRFASVRVPLPRDCHRIVRALSLVAPLGVELDASQISSDPDWRAGLSPIRDDPDAAAAIERRLLQLDRGTAPLVLLHPGTSAFGSFKRWPAERFGRLARQLNESAGAAVLIAHGPGEEELAQEVSRESGESATILAPEGGIAGLVALLRRVDLVIAADSGPPLLASALGVPTVTLFGPKDPATYAPTFADGRVVRNRVPCSPCSLRSCPDPVCMTRLEVEPVRDAALELLAVRTASPTVG